MAAYDGMRMAWLPHVVYLQEPNFRSSVVNTDKHGFRLSAAPDGSLIGLDDVIGKPFNLLVGNSTAFGVGASRDDATLASALARMTGETWLNFSGRSYSSTQELLLFQTHLADLKTVRRIVIFGGANNLILYHRSRLYPKRYGSFFFWRQFEHAMLDSALTVNRRWLKAILSPFYGDRIDYGNLPLARLPLALLGLDRARVPDPDWPSGRGPRTADEVLAWMARDLELWRMLADHIHAEILFVLQPLGCWTEKSRSPEEQALFDAVGASRRRFDRVLAHDFDSNMHDWYSSGLREICQRVRIDYVDLNHELSNAGVDGDWIFNDYIHLTDQGYDMAARMITDRLADVN